MSEIRTGSETMRDMVAEDLAGAGKATWVETLVVLGLGVAGLVGLLWIMGG